MVSGRKHTNYFPITETEAYKGYEKKQPEKFPPPRLPPENIIVAIG